MTVEKVLDELWIGVKGQSNLEISCSPRNNFRVSLVKLCAGVEHWIHKGVYRPTEGNQTPNTVSEPGSETVGDKLHCQEGNSPDRRLRSLILC